MVEAVLTMLHDGTPIYDANGKVIGRIYGEVGTTETAPQSAENGEIPAPEPKAEETPKPKPKTAKTAQKSAQKK